LSGFLKHWARHRYHPPNPTQLFIVTTKEGRFVKQLLQQQGIELPEERIIGKECKRPKHQTLRQLFEMFPGDATTLWFVEDRLKTLQSVQQQPDLTDVRLYLADWGYNTTAHQEVAAGMTPKFSYCPWQSLHRIFQFGLFRLSSYKLVLRSRRRRIGESVES
jgi:hypothetical protein